MPETTRMTLAVRKLRTSKVIFTLNVQCRVMCATTRVYTRRCAYRFMYSDARGL